MTTSPFITALPSLQFDDMISVQEALALIRQQASLLPPVRKPLPQAFGLVLAEDYYAPINIPSFNQSAMDGYAFCFANWQPGHSLTIAGEVAAGDAAGQAMQPGTAVRIFTGAALPDGYDTVVMQEKTTVTGASLLISDHELRQGNNVRQLGSEIKKSELALAKGTLLSPAAVGFLAGLGAMDLLVIPKPVVQIVVTGNELQKPGKELQHGQVYESNGVMLQAALAQLRIENVAVSYAKDKKEDIEGAINEALRQANLVLITGGVSVGNYDLVVPAARACGVEMLFHKVAQRPGKPLYAGRKGATLVFGLPGNPASVLTCFYNYVVTAIEGLTGQNLRQTKQAILVESFVKTVPLTQFLKAVVSDGKVRLLTAQDSFRLSSFALANCLVVLPQEKTTYAEGETVETIRLPYL